MGNQAGDDLGTRGMTWVPEEWPGYQAGDDLGTRLGMTWVPGWVLS